MRRAAIFALLGVLATAPEGLAASVDPSVKLRTETQKEALAKGSIAVGVRIGDRSRVRVRAKFNAGVSRNFRLDPVVKGVGRKGSVFHLDLSTKQRQILAAAIDVCAPVEVAIRARAIDLPRTPSTKLEAELDRPGSCGS